MKQSFQPLLLCNKNSLKSGWGKLRGFTLIELMVVVGIAALITALALPSFTDFVQRFQIDRYAANLRGTINNARQQALRTGLDTVVCKRIPLQNACSTVPNQGYQNGWIVFHDQTAAFTATAALTDRNGIFDPTEMLIQATDGTTANFITQSFPNAAANNPPIAISGQGLSLANGNVCIMVCAANGCGARPNNRYVIVSQSGHVRVETQASFAGVTTGVCQ
jgi:prepilin-type N-terminal cleavage/methylation domain-containing protein